MKVPERNETIKTGKELLEEFAIQTTRKRQKRKLKQRVLKSLAYIPRSQVSHWYVCLFCYTYFVRTLAFLAC